MLSALLVTLREGLEASLIIGIILAYLARTGNRQGFKPVWIGTVLAVVASIIAGVIIYLTAGELTGKAEQIYEGSALLVAAGVLTWMIFWMRKQAVNIRGELQAQVATAVKSGSSKGLILLAFIAVVREGVETALFLFAATSTTQSPLLSTLGGLLGLIIAVGLGYSLYKGTSRLNLRVFFTITGVFLILFAAGLLAHSIHEFEEVGIIAPVVEHFWDTSRFLAEDSFIGSFLTSLFGYNDSPSLTEAIVYFAYLVLTLAGYFFRAPARKKAVA